MKEIHYTDYFRYRMQFRHISAGVPEEIYLNATERYFDTETLRDIAVHQVRLGRRRRAQMMLAYEEYAEHVEFVTIHKINRREINFRIQTGRWIPK
ncbi:MAG: hypothetical protein H8D67_11640 [Deltaproteobacteria bacterium]|nr:hypothetical protein [Deltaproteobacteria bacterium]